MTPLARASRWRPSLGYLFFGGLVVGVMLLGGAVNRGMRYTGANSSCDAWYYLGHSLAPGLTAQHVGLSMEYERQLSRLGIWVPLRIAEWIFPAPLLGVILPVLVALASYIGMCLIFALCAKKSIGVPQAAVAAALAVTPFYAWSLDNADMVLKPVAATYGALGVAFLAAKMCSAAPLAPRVIPAGLVWGALCALTWTVFMNIGIMVLASGILAAAIALAFHDAPGVARLRIAAQAIAGALVGATAIVAAYGVVGALALGESIPKMLALFAKQGTFIFDRFGFVQNWTGPSFFTDPLGAVIASPGLIILITVIALGSGYLAVVRPRRQPQWTALHGYVLASTALAGAFVAVVAHALVLDLYSDKMTTQWLIPLLLLGGAMFGLGDRAPSGREAAFQLGRLRIPWTAAVPLVGIALLLAMRFLIAGPYFDARHEVWNLLMAASAVVVAAVWVSLAAGKPGIGRTAAALAFGLSAVFALGQTGNYYRTSADRLTSAEGLTAEVRIAMSDLAQLERPVLVAGKPDDFNSASSPTSALYRALSNCGTDYSEALVRRDGWSTRVHSALSVVTEPGLRGRRWAERVTPEIGAALGQRVVLEARSQPLGSGLVVWTITTASPFRGFVARVRPPE